MEENKIISKESLGKLFDKIKSTGVVIHAPVGEDKNVEFKEVANFKEINHEYIQTIQSPKSLVFPKHETMFEFEKVEGEMKLKDVNTDEFKETVLWGAHPCDAVGFGALNAIFTWDYQDKYFIDRLKKLTVISLSCTKGDSYCFCTSVGINPGCETGSDILLTPIGNDKFLAQILTEKGEKIYKLASELFENAGNVNKEEHLAKIEKAFDYEELNKKLATNFDDKVWEEIAMRCLGCGACAYVCPACACFDIQDEGTQEKGKRVRCWDSCGLDMFTLHTSGHNPREEQFQRMRQRIMHKFSYMPERQNVYGCSGCGRCGRACSVDMNLLENIKKIMEA
ncbi:MAG: 4Fe-4S dicluster domain-containing protein [Bacteroidota bacterium]